MQFLVLDKSKKQWYITEGLSRLYKNVRGKIPLDGSKELCEQNADQAIFLKPYQTKS